MNDKFKRKFYIKYEFRNILIRSFLKNKQSNNVTKHYVYLKFVKLYKWYSKTHNRNTCIISGRSHNVFRKFKLARFFLRTESHKLKFSGFRRKSW